MILQGVLLDQGSMCGTITHTSNSVECSSKGSGRYLAMEPFVDGTCVFGSCTQILGMNRRSELGLGFRSPGNTPCSSFVQMDCFVLFDCNSCPTIKQTVTIHSVAVAFPGKDHFIDLNRWLHPTNSSIFRA